MRFQPVERGCTRLSPPGARLECQPHLLGPRRPHLLWGLGLVNLIGPRTARAVISRCRGRCVHVLRSRTKIEAQMIAPLEALKELGDSDVAIETAALLDDKHSRQDARILEAARGHPCPGLAQDGRGCCRLNCQRSTALAIAAPSPHLTSLEGASRELQQWGDSAGCSNVLPYT
jgi:hypothetical protein